MTVTLYITQVNSQVIRPEEKALLSRLVNIMVSLELRFVQERAEDGQLVYKLDPWVLHLFRVNTPGANAHLQAGGYICDVRRQACNGYRAATLCRAAPCCYGGWFSTRELVVLRLRYIILTGSSHRSTLSSLLAMRRQWSEQNRQRLPPSLVAQDRPKMQVRTTLNETRARGCSCLPMPQTNHRGNEIKRQLPM